MKNLILKILFFLTVSNGLFAQFQDKDFQAELINTYPDIDADKF